MQERCTFEEALCLFGGGVPLGLSLHRLSDGIRIALAKALAKLPKKIVEWASLNVIFISSNNESPAFIIPRILKPWKGAVFLSDCLLDESEDMQSFIIAHEIAHFRLKHKGSPFERLTEEEYQKQQRDADELARKWLGPELVKTLEDEKKE